MSRLYSFLVLIFAIGFISGCGSDEDEPEVKAPTNLTVSVDVTTDGSGKVTFTASAEGATYYELEPGDEASAIPKKATNGAFSYLYEESGNYTATVTAFATEDLFISTTEEITVSVFISIPATGYSTPTEYDGMVSYWAEEFDGSELNLNDWKFEIGDGCPDVCGWGNNELEYYKSGNTSIVDGHLVITAKKESAGSKNYTSSRIITRGKKSVKYGRIDVRAVMPKGQGIWPAIWMLGESIGTLNWPQCGEIDIMEMIGGSGREKTVHGTIHYDDGGYKSNTGHYDLPSGLLSDKFHVFSIVWTDEMITWYIDDIKYSEYELTAARAEFKEEFFFILNVAVGGNWPGSPDATLIFPQRMIVDYIRVFQPE